MSTSVTAKRDQFKIRAADQIEKAFLKTNFTFSGS